MLDPEAFVSIVSVFPVRKSQIRIVELSSVSIVPFVPKMRGRRPPIGAKAVIVKDAVTPPSYSKFTTWWSTTSLSHAKTQRP